MDRSRPRAWQRAWQRDLKAASLITLTEPTLVYPLIRRTQMEIGMFACRENEPKLKKSGM